MTKTMRILLVVVVLIAFVLRVNAISRIPPSMSWDEVSIGYNAYSILKTGADEHGVRFPIQAFKAYGDYKPPLSIYLTVPFVGLFGLTEFAVRFPVALMGTLSVLLAYAFTFLLFETFRNGNPDNSKSVRNSGTLGIITATLLAFSPWHINLSRAGFEATIAHTFILLGCVFILYARKHPQWWTLAFLPFVASVYTFNSARYAAPLIVAGFLAVLRHDVRLARRQVAGGVVIAFVFLLPIVPHLVSKEARLRLAEVSIFTDVSVVEKANERIAADGNAWWARILHNRRIGYAKSYIIHFADNLEPWFLFIKGDGNPKFSIQDVGQMYLMEAPFFAVGFVALLSQNPGLGIFLLYFIMSAIAPAAVARETPHALRTLNTLPAWQIFEAYGLVAAAGLVKRKPVWLKPVTYAAVGFLFAANIAYYLHEYYVHYPVVYSGEWQYGYREAIRYVMPRLADYDTVTVTESIGRPYMYALFYTGYDPAKFVSEKQSYTDAAGFYHVEGFGKFRFARNLVRTKTGGRNLVVGDPSWVREGDKVLTTVRLLNGTPVLVIFEI